MDLKTKQISYFLNKIYTDNTKRYHNSQMQNNGDLAHMRRAGEGTFNHSNIFTFDLELDTNSHNMNVSCDQRLLY